jgi:uncharacterized protein
MLVEGKKDLVFQKNEQGNSPLHWAALTGNLEIVKYLVECGADVSLKNEAGRYPIFEAEQSGEDKVVAFLLQFMNPDGVELEDQTACIDN